MKTRLFTTVAPAAVVGGIILLLGCGAESKKTGASNNGPVVITANAAAQTNDPAPAAEPVPEIVTAPAKLSAGLEEIVQLAQAGVGDDVLLAYIENSPTSYKLEIEEILYLHDLGISVEVIAELVRHGQSTPEPAPALAGATPAPSTPAENVNTNPPPPAAETAPSDANAYAVTPPVQQVNNNYFYQTLAPYGAWIEMPEYGWCWRPTVAVVDASWRPYGDRGRWLWTDCGWYWQSDYAWGWAPFHYGRWHRSPAYGWCWLPGTTWGPAWVTWRYSDSYCGWAPLPPGAHFDVGIGFSFHGGRVGLGFDFGLVSDCFTFIPTARFCDSRPWHHRLPPTQVGNIFNRTTIINNYTAGSNHRTVVNLGPGANAIAAVSRSEIRKVTLRDVNPNGGTLIKSDRLERDGRTLAVFRPQLPKQASAPPPEITRRQQVLRAKTDTLVNSDVVRLARADAERKTTIAPATRGSARTEASQLHAPLIAPRPTDPAAGTYALRTGEARRSTKETDPKAVESTTRAPAQPAISRSPRSESRIPGQSPVLVKPSRQEPEARPTVVVPPRTFESRRADSDGRSVAVQQRPQPELRPQASPRPTGIPEQRPQFGYQPPPANPPSVRQESRRSASGAPNSSALPANARPSAQSITPPPTVIQPRVSDRRSSSPEYRAPQNNFSPPPATAPRFSGAPGIRPSSPAPTVSRPQPAPTVSRPQPAPTVSRPQPAPTVSRPQPAPSSPPPASRPSSPPSQSRGESRRN